MLNDFLYKHTTAIRLKTEINNFSSLYWLQVFEYSDSEIDESQFAFHSTFRKSKYMSAGNSRNRLFQDLV